MSPSQLVRAIKRTNRLEYKMVYLRSGKPFEAKKLEYVGGRDIIIDEKVYETQQILFIGPGLHEAGRKVYGIRSWGENCDISKTGIPTELPIKTIVTPPINMKRSSGNLPGTCKDCDHNINFEICKNCKHDITRENGEWWHIHGVITSKSCGYGHYIREGCHCITPWPNDKK